MLVIRSIKDCRGNRAKALFADKRTVGVTIGNFDGMHLGHLELFKQLKENLSEMRGDPTKVVLTFRPHPKTVLKGVRRSERMRDQQFAELTAVRRKIEIAQENGIDAFFAERFTKDFAQFSPLEFVKKYLVETLKAKLVVVGHDWAFGRDRSGGIGRLKELGEQFGFRTLVVPPVEQSGIRISSSSIKQAIGEGQFDRVRALLGRSFELTGRVRRGAGRGKGLGFATANLFFWGQVLPPDGIYAAKALLGRDWLDAVVYIGKRPTFEEEGEAERFVEVHFLEYNQSDFYGQRLHVRFLEMLRGDQKFERQEDLIEMMEQDVRRARDILAAASDEQFTT